MMKYIKKEQEPEKLRSWFNNQYDEEGNRLGCDYYDDVPSDVKRDVKEHLLKEQGFLCCYTGILIDTENSHIEHLKPYSICRNEKNYEDVNYFNLVTAYPGRNYKSQEDENDEDDELNQPSKKNKNSKKCPFGAHAKENWYERDNFVTPLQLDCEDRFKFDDFGKVQATNHQDTAAQITIEKLVLNHQRLIDLRKAAIDEAIFPIDIELDASDIQKIANGLYSQKNEEGKFRQFCLAIEQVARQLI
ncbi:retron system putative HNH endonuclease [Limnospira sp. PMC 289.06]|uniref:retron system putative HNH endonuclease n=1 Tax=Limnospira sp. PMC 289.06 TaxID=2981094 RepID=UPI0028E159BA|nr:TIGR02646 family protein [Limnospira sp. PMC 289.06]